MVVTQTDGGDAPVALPTPKAWQTDDPVETIPTSVGGHIEPFFGRTEMCERR